jgi:1A family penicillin-binding protein
MARKPVRQLSRHRRRPATQGGRNWLKALLFLFVVPILLGMGLAVAAVGTAYSYYVQTAAAIEHFQGATFETTKIYDRNGTLLTELFDPRAGRRTHVTLDEIPKYLVEATVATEDATFFSNPGVDVRGILRAAWVNLQGGEISQGGSTITQQLVRNVILADEKFDRSFSRKLREAVLALELTRRYSKEQILEMYLNEVYYGNLAYGVEAAAEAYFGKQAKDLTLSEAALLAGLPQAPTLYDPTINFDVAKERQRQVLNLMVKQGYLTQQEADEAFRQPLNIRRRHDVQMLAPHFVNYVKEILEEKYGPEVVNRGGLTVYTTLDLRFQQLAEQAVRSKLEELRQRNARNAALVAMKPGTGEILAMVGSADFYDETIDGQVNVANSERQPGSSFKPIVYAEAFNKGWGPGTVVLDDRTGFPGGPGGTQWFPRNYDGRYHGYVTLRSALANSYNIPAVKVLQFVGVAQAIDLAHRMGITGLNRGLRWYGLSLVLGGGEVKLVDMVNAYSVFANYGEFVPKTAILKVIDRNGNTLEELDPQNLPRTRVLSPQIAWLISDVLSDNRARTPMFGANSPLRLSRPAAAKTGTTENYVDSWTIGYTPYLATGVWVGNSDSRPMYEVAGAVGAARVWNAFMEAVFSHPELEQVLSGQGGKLQLDFVRPTGLVFARCVSIMDTRDRPLEEATPTTESSAPVFISSDWWPADKIPRGQCTPTGSSTPTVPSLEQPTPTPTPSPTPVPVPPGWTRVPDVFGMPEEQALRAIREAGLVVGSVNYQTQKDMPPGVNINIVQPRHVLSVTPTYGTVLPKGSIVFVAVRKE